MMVNYKNILIHEIHQQVKSLKFLFMFVFAILVSSLYGYILINQFKQDQVFYHNEQQKIESIKKNVKVYSECHIPISIPPTPLSIFSRGVIDKVGNIADISINSLPELRGRSEKNNPFLNIFSNFDIEEIIIIIISLMVLFLSSDSISEERENGTLKLVFSNTITRFEFFLAKYVGNLIIIILTIFLIFAIISMMLLVSNDINIHPMDWFKIFCIFISNIFYTSIFLLIGLIFSSSLKSTSSSIILSLSVWLFLLFIYPYSISYFINNVNNSSSNKIETDIKQVQYDFLVKSIKLSDKMYHNKDMSCNCSIGFDEPYLSYLTKVVDVTQKYHFDFLTNYNKEIIPELISSQNKMMNIYEKNRNEQSEKLKLDQIFKCFLPNNLLTNFCQKISNTDSYNRDVNLRLQIQQFRNGFIEYLKEKDAFGYSFFTQMKKEDMKDNYDEYILPENSKLLYQNYIPLVINDLPVFSYKPILLFPYEIISLFFYNLILFIVGVYCFLKSKLF